MSLVATLTPGALPTRVDAYVLLHLPDGAWWSLTRDGGLVPGIVPIIANLEPAAFSGEVFCTRVAAGVPPGQYAWLGGLTLAGRADLVGSVSHQPFTLRP